MNISSKMVHNSINKKFVKPLKDGCKYNISKLDVEQKVKHNETASLLKQAHQTLLNIEYNLKCYNLVDSNTLLRASFEYIIMAMLIQFDEETYKEFIKIGIQRDKTRVCKMFSKFRTYMNEISEQAFKDINRSEKLFMLTDFYDKMCNYTHSTLIVSTMIEIKNQKEKEVLGMIVYQNYYFVKILLFLCLKYFTKDNKHYLELQNVGFTYFFLTIEINEKIKNNNIDFTKYNDFLYVDKNTEYFEKSQKEVLKFNDEISELKDIINKNPIEFNNKLLDFLK